MAKASVKATWTADAQKAISESERYQKAQKKVIESLQKQVKESKSTGRQHKKMTDDMASGSKKATDGIVVGAAKAAAAYLSLAAAIGLVKTTLADLDQQRAQSAANIQAAESGMLKLAQLGGGDPVKVAALQAEARQTYLEGGAPTLDQAAVSLFDIKSANMGEHRKLFSDLYGPVKNAGIFAKAANTLIESRGAEETGSLPEVLSKAFAASAHAPGSAEQLLMEAAKSGSLARGLGISDESLVSATAISSTKSKSMEVGGTRIESFLNAVSKKGGFEGKGLPAIVREIDAKGLKDADLIKYLGEKEAFKGFSDLRYSLPGLEQYNLEQEEAAESGLVYGVAKSAQTGRYGAARVARKAKARHGIAREKQGVIRLHEDALIDTSQAIFEEQGRPVKAALSGRGLKMHRGAFGWRGETHFMDQKGTPEEKAALDTALSGFPTYEKPPDIAMEYLRRPKHHDLGRALREASSSLHEVANQLDGQNRTARR